MKKYTNVIKFILSLLVIALLYGFAAHRNSLKESRKVKVIFENGDNLFVSYETVNKLLIQKLETNYNQSKENINLNDLEQFLRSNEMIENAEIFLTLRIMIFLENKLLVWTRLKDLPIVNLNCRPE